MWGAGAVAVLVVYHRDSKAAIPRGDGAEESERADRWENAVIIAGVSGIFALYVLLLVSFLSGPTAVLRRARKTLTAGNYR